MESLEGIEDQGRNTERGQSQSAHPLFISDSSRRQITSKASPCYQIAKGPWDVPGWKTGHQDPPGKLHTGLWLSLQGITQLLPLGEEVATSPPLGNTLDRGCRVIESRAVATGLLHFHYPTTLGEGTKASLTHCPVAQGSSFHPVKASPYPSQWPRGRVQPPLLDPHNLLRTQRGLIASATFQMKKLRFKRLSRFVSLKPTMAHSHSGIALSPLLGI